jgi:MraZ protein
MEMLIGEYRNTLDEKGRVSFPSKLRAVLQQNELWVTQGLDHCLMLFTTEEWTKLKERVVGSVSVFDKQKREVLRRFIGPAARIEFDKSGRLSIPQNLRDFASLKMGGECVILGIDKYMELWDSEEYAKNAEESEASFQMAAQSMGDILL